ncbi:hypothetical protein EG329_003780 [Mollisiaceae sp. DMI_Dod_QoI]|nr:hypothetical protein EG329_003780 [Helotiales sp. DMI_Dod_QoI]
MCLFIPHFMHHNKIKVQSDKDLLPFRQVIPPAKGRILTVASTFMYNNDITVTNTSDASNTQARKSIAAAGPESHEDTVDIRINPRGLIGMTSDGGLVGCKGVDTQGLLIFDVGTEEMDCIEQDHRVTKGMVRNKEIEELGGDFNFEVGF